ncbi:MAG: oxygen-independent coproporphyrinogen III oxidase [Methylococcaceae bacterium]|nr:oxygen-independent coproporphyrinogen III oxidase [Methylococcaceae bacterium]MDZ4155568.1 oxygen-independent coproporphyrinogen III oxidase [Methylococcales bacterium]MDP2395291.1 oxygen-independent coproporphyrinogen III oxidase [Methylococcaceae bacterium]MDP3020597.1 oxygen-independent coproporphyrinogen III oxidase [Methylococcaceae bacterium]MDP3390036.1 oxygen-independent coproporphyrinogen III oxidase [Methylococcaceae bacterium]
MNQSIQFDLDLINRYDKAGPRYTSYPTALELHSGFTDQDYRQHIAKSNASGGPLSLYFHIPFCDTVCFYCACNKIVTKNRNHAVPYLENLLKEIAMQGALFDKTRVVNQLHWGGGTPTFLSYPQMQQLMAATREHFHLRDDDEGEYSIEVDPRETNDQTIKQLRELGFNRISLGLQDFDPAVQKAVNRLQSEEQTFAVLEAARAEGFRSTNIDLIYGLPLQTVDTFAKTLETVLAVSPDRFSIFNYAHMPARFKTQRQINDDDLPTADVKLAILQMVGLRLIEAGYAYIGMDHFAKPDDELAVAQREGKLYRNFQGYSTHSDCDLVGLGITSIGRVGDAYIQNVKELDEYDQLIKQGKLPVFKGVDLNDDDKLRREVITQLICHFSLNFSRIEQQFGIDFSHYFADELRALAIMQADGLLSLTSKDISVLPAGRLLIRNVCMVFDKYLAQKKQQQFSKVI